MTDRGAAPSRASAIVELVGASCASSVVDTIEALPEDSAIDLTDPDPPADRAFYQVAARNNTFCARHRDSRTSILELKHDPEWADRAAEIAARLPFRMTKSSKYVQGVDLLTAC